MINTKLAVRPALQSDHTAIANLMYFEPRVHRHLDWRGPLEWLGVPEYWVLEQGDSIVSALACPPDPQGVAWLRFFAHVSGVPLMEAWQALWQVALPALKERGFLIGAITVSEWFGPLLLESGFSITQQIVVLEHDSVEFKLRPAPPHIVMRSMTDRDLQAVARVDQEGFAPLWRNSIQALRSGYNQSGFATVALLDGEIVGYQISTRNSFGVHLARLAVLPACQGRGIGYGLVQDLLLQSRRAGLRRLTVNTQNDNRMSLALYQKIGFELTGEQYTVYTLYT